MVNSPIPTDLATECRRAARTLKSFMPIGAGSGFDQFIPPHLLERAKGLAIFTVVKAGFLFSGRAGSGLVVARLPDGSWSAPSAIGTGGIGFGGQIGAEITDFVILLNTEDAVRAFSLGGNVTLGGNLSVAAGPVGRTAEAAGTVGKLAPIFSYSKTKGLFAGVSIEGSILIERTDTNEKFYHRRVTARELLSGDVPPPPEAAPLYEQLVLKATPSHAATTATTSAAASHPPPPIKPKPTLHHSTTMSSVVSATPVTARPPAPPIPPRHPTAIALYDFDAVQDGDLSFKQGEIITLLRHTSNTQDWWHGKVGNQEGTFPANYVQLQ